MNRSHTIARGFATLAAVGSLAACSSSTDPTSSSASSASSSGTTAASSPKTITSTVTPTTSGSSSQGGETASAPRSGGPCAESQLRASVKGVNVGLDKYRVVRVTFANISSSTCSLTGYPGAAIEDSSNHQIQQAKRTVGGPVGGTIERVRTVTLRPGGSAYAYLEGKSTREVGAAQAGCDAPKYPRILITPPNTDTPVPFTIGWPQCHQFNVHPVRVD